MMEKIPAAVILAICLAMLLRLALGERRRRSFDALGLRTWTQLARRCASASRWWSNRRYATDAARDAIRRARSDVPRDGNVYRPESFRGPRKPH